MNKHRVILSTVSLVIFLGIVTPHFAQNVPGGPEKPDQQRRAHAVGLMRSINTAEVVEFSNFGSFASWDGLLAHGLLPTNYLQEASLHFSAPPEIWPGWSLRFNVHADGKGYDVKLQDLRDKTCAYAVFTDESGVIGQGKAINCEIQ